MASIFGHGMVSYTITKVAAKAKLKILMILAIVSSILPDIDIVAFKLGIPYEAPLGHRGFTHSIMFALLWAIAMVFIFGKTQKKLFFFVIFFSTVSHGILDALTNGGKGVGFFIPFENSRYFFPWQVIKVSPLGVHKFISEWGLQVILSELKYILLPCLLVLVFLHFYRINK